MLVLHGVSTTPFYNVVLCAPSTTRDQVDRYAEGLRDCLAALGSGDALA